jgi:ABC-type protease/lipase transport system fused ATPase/permease subunit
MIRELFFFIFIFNMFINMIEMINVKFKLQIIDVKSNNMKNQIFFHVILICM